MPDEAGPAPAQTVGALRNGAPGSRDPRRYRPWSPGGCGCWKTRATPSSRAGLRPRHGRGVARVARRAGRGLGRVKGERSPSSGRVLRIQCGFARARLAPERLGGISEGCGSPFFGRYSSNWETWRWLVASRIALSPRRSWRGPNVRRASSRWGGHPGGSATRRCRSLRESFAPPPCAASTGGSRKGRDGSDRGSSVPGCGYGLRPRAVCRSRGGGRLCAPLRGDPGWPWRPHRAKIEEGWEARAAHGRGQLPRG